MAEGHSWAVTGPFRPASSALNRATVPGGDANPAVLTPERLAEQMRQLRSELPALQAERHALLEQLTQARADAKVGLTEQVMVL